MNEVILKYLCVVDKDINSKEKLFRLLKSRSTFLIEHEKNEINLIDSKINFVYKLKMIKKSTSNNKSMFTLSCTFKDVNSAEKTNRELGKIFGNFIQDEIVILYDGISKYYNSMAYELLYDIETYLRSFITELMTFMGNPNWFRHDLNKILNINDTKDTDLRVLYSRNFDQLREFLFTDYSDYSYEDIIQEIVEKNIDENSKISVLEIKDKLPKTNWDKFIEKDASKNSIDRKAFKKLLEELYKMRNKIAHCNSINKQQFENFKKNCNKMKEYLNILTEIIEDKHLDLYDHSIENDISAIFAPIDFYDTIIVPAKEDGFNEVFLGEDSWYSVSIWDERIPSIKYIVAYITHPTQQITHYAKVRKIETSPFNDRKK